MALPADPHTQAGSCSSPPITSATSRWPPGLHRALAAAGGAASSRSAPSATALAGGFDDIHFRSAPTSRGTPTAVEDRQRALRGGGDSAGQATAHPNALSRDRPVQPAAIHHRRGPGAHPRHIEDDNGSFHWKTPEQGAATSVLLATSPLLEGDRRPLLRRLQRGRTKPARHRRWGRPLCARPRRGGAALADLPPDPGILTAGRRPPSPTLCAGSGGSLQPQSIMYRLVVDRGCVAGGGQDLLGSAGCGSIPWNSSFSRCRWVDGIALRSEAGVAHCSRRCRRSSGGAHRPDGFGTHG